MTVDPSSQLKVQCVNCNSILVTTLGELKGEVFDCRFCGEDLRPAHDDPNCSFCRGEGFALVSDVVWICQLGVEV
jgi:hypothetical protein